MQFAMLIQNITFILHQSQRLIIKMPKYNIRGGKFIYKLRYNP
jgi:hypothetical protein